MGLNTIHYQGRLIFILTPDKVIVKTPLGQSFYLLPRAHYWQRRLKTIRLMIELGEVRDLNELASWTNPGISWETTGIHYEVEKDEALV